MFVGVFVGLVGWFDWYVCLLAGLVVFSLVFCSISTSLDSA